MLGAGIHAQLARHLTAQRALGHHADDSVLHSELRLLSHQLTILGLLKAAGITGMMVVHLLIELLAGQNHLGGVDDDHMIAGVAVGSVGGLILTAQNRGNLAGQAAERHAVGVHNIPLALDGLGICHKRFHVNSSIILKIRI